MFSKAGWGNVNKVRRRGKEEEGRRGEGYSCDHNTSTASSLEEILDISDGVDITIGKDRNRNSFHQSSKSIPISRTI
jgi:hypothetical protein